MTPIPVPPSLILHNNVWTVEQHRTRRTFCAVQRAAAVEGRGLQGFCLYDQRQIHLAPHKDPRSLGRTFLHETLHACGSEQEWGNEEDFIAAIEDPLATVIEGMLP